MVIISTGTIMDKKDLISNSDEDRDNRGLVSIARGWVYIHGLVLSSYCYLFLFIMAFLFLLGGGLLTAISFRPLEVRERLGEWSYPIATSKNTRIAGPGLILLGIVMAITSLVLCQASRRLYANSRLTVLPTCIIQQVDGSNVNNANPGFHSCHDSPQHMKEISVFSVVQNRDKSFFSDGYSEKSELLMASDIACFPGGNTPRSVTPICTTNSGLTNQNNQKNSPTNQNALNDVTWTNAPSDVTWTNQNICIESERINQKSLSDDATTNQSFHYGSTLTNQGLQSNSEPALSAILTSNHKHPE
jgi:hypothetical protein